MSFANAIERIRVLTAGERTTLWLVRFQGTNAVLKQYGVEEAEWYRREVRHVEQFHRAGFTDMPAILRHDDAERSILYEYVPAGNVWARLLACRDEQRDQLICRTLDAMEREAAMLQNPALRERSGVGPNPYVCIHRLARRAEAGDVRFALLRALARAGDRLPGPFLTTRYDPELTNYLLASDGRVIGCDFAGIRCCHAFYLPAYAFVHVALAWQRMRDPEARVVLGSFARAARARFVTDHTRRCLWLLNLAEVFAYFVDWALRKTMPLNAWHLRGVLTTGRKVVELVT